MQVDIEQWCTEIKNFNECLHYAIIKLKINLFNVFKINIAFHFSNIIFVFVLLFIVLKLTVTNTGLCFEFNQQCHKQILY